MVTKIQISTEFEKLISNPQLIVAHFAADWVEQCKDVNNVLRELATQAAIVKSGIKFCECPAEDLPEISLKHGIEAVPTILLFRGGQVIDRVNGADPGQITEKIKKYQHASSVESPETYEPPKSQVSLDERLKQLTHRHNVMVFMKGDRLQPRCGFSKQLIQILLSTGLEYDTFDILQDEEVRQGLKTYSDWPTYPQVYVKGELIGGLDIIKEMNLNGELISTLTG